MKAGARTGTARSAAAFAAALLLVALAGASATRRETTVRPAATTDAAAFRTSGRALAARATTARLRWQGGPTIASTGERVTVFVSEAYASDPGAVLRWANFFASLLHGAELGGLEAYVAPVAEVVRMCGERTLGCYGENKLVTIGDDFDGVAATEVAAHEYGHHVAANRPNPPWRSVEWGPKHWASTANVCSRAAAGSIFPGDEGKHYSLNPGEGFAEAYRVANEVRGGRTSFAWPIVDASFVPDAAARAAIEADVLRPWRAPATTTFTGRFAGTRTVATYRLRTPLDGDLTATLRLPGGSTYELQLLAANRKTVLAAGLWSGTTTKKLAYSVCGERSLVLRVVRRGAPGRYVVRASTP